MASERPRRNLHTGQGSGAGRGWVTSSGERAVLRPQQPQCSSVFKDKHLSKGKYL